MNLSDEIMSLEKLEQIESLSVLPSLIRDEENNRYSFPEEVQNKVFRFNDKFILFNISSYEEITFNHIAFIIKFLIEYGLIKKNDNIKEILEEHEKYFDNINELLKKIDFDAIPHIKTQVNNIVEEFESVNKDIANKYSEIEKKVENIKSEDNQELINDLNSIKIQINEIYSKIDDLHLIIHENDQNHFNLPSEEELINKIGTKIWERLSNSSIELDENYKSSIESRLEYLNNKVLEMSNNNGITTQIALRENNPNDIKDINMSKLIQLKSAGFDAQEISILREKGLI